MGIYTKNAYICANYNIINDMKTKLIKNLSDRCKDMGLTSKAIEELATLGLEGLADDASDADIIAKVDLLVPFAKSMQAEITRKTRGHRSKSIKTSSADEDVDEVDNDGDNGVPVWFKKQMETFDTRLQALQDENDKLKAEQAKTARESLIASKAKQLGIPSYLMKRVVFAEDADIDKELAEYKQELVNNNLVPKEQAHETGTNDEAMKEAAKSWAESLPNQ